MKTPLLALSLCLIGLVSCVSAPPTAEVLQQKAVGYLGATMEMGVPKPSISFEPTGVRWTLLRESVPKDQYDLVEGGPLSAIHKNYPDTILGISFGHGLFLDSRGNLALTPLELFETFHFEPGKTYTTQVAEEIWTPGSTSDFTVQKTGTGIQVTKNGLFTNPVTMVPGTTEYTAMDRRTGKNDDGSYFDTTTLPAPDVFHKYEIAGNLIKHTAQVLTSSVTTSYLGTDKGVTSSDNSFRVIDEGDHWRISIATDDGSREWVYYATANKAILINTKTGDTATIEASDGRMTITAPDLKEAITPRP